MSIFWLYKRQKTTISLSQDKKAINEPSIILY